MHYLQKMTENDFTFPVIFLLSIVFEAAKANYVFIEWTNVHLRRTALVQKVVG